MSDSGQPCFESRKRKCSWVRFILQETALDGWLQQGGGDYEQFFGKPKKMESSLASPNCRSLFYFIFHPDGYAYALLLRSRCFTGWGGERMRKGENLCLWNSELTRREADCKTDALRTGDLLWLLTHTHTHTESNLFCVACCSWRGLFLHLITKNYTLGKTPRRVIGPS